ncbi:hypothetical protein FH972_026308 [Carpinus fangiana]|uniref:Peptide N-acetyl-beta-D-glucosaminyl asparaginase amidase A N-terminal domain-containing protein n=1 Tax=Carpinus fangiana TaxID=176857 RepID=A0A5N6L665_9ROSI|nr:hypothetical protein FH972_026308 [Carpinus fangiana]
MDATRIDTDERRNMEKMNPLLDEESCGTNVYDTRMAQVQHTTKRAWAVTALVVIFLVALGNMISETGLCNASVLPTSAQSPGHTLAKYAVAAAAPLLRVFQVYPPVLTPSAGGAVLTDGSASQASGGTSGCVVTQMLMEYSFGNSYGQPFVGPYVPPSCSFNRVTFNFTVTSAGRQFDRLAVAYFGDTELWRTSTAEPTKDGIIWTYVKDMTSYLSLFKEKQTLIFDLGNIINDIYTGPFNTTLQATFFTADDTVQPADKIVPISARLGSKKMPSAWQYPTNASNRVTLPRNIQRAVFSVSATGQSAEEFWYSNVLSSDVNTFGPDAGLLPYSPFRETQIYIDDKLAGVAWPFPIIFTGGIVPGLWRPIVGIDAYDLREDEIDITPWLPLLCDGAPHRFEIRVAGISDDGNHHGQLTDTVGTYWVLTGKIFLWLDNAHPNAITTGTPPRLSVPAPSISLASVTGKTIKGVNQTLTYDVNVTRNLAITSTIRTAAGSRPAAWIQHLTYSNHGVFSAFGTTQYTKQTSSGFDTAIPGPYARHFTYPITVNTSYIQSATTSDITIDAVLSRGQDIQVLGVPVFPTGLQSFAAAQGKTSPSFQGSELRTSQNGSAHYQSTNNNAASSSYGSTEQNMIFAGIRTDNVESAAANGQFPSIQGSGELYRRHVLAVNGSVVSDNESFLGRPFGGMRSSSVTSEVSGEFAGGDGVRDLIGHGPPS